MPGLSDRMGSCRLNNMMSRGIRFRYPIGRRAPLRIGGNPSGADAPGGGHEIGEPNVTIRRGRCLPKRCRVQRASGSETDRSSAARVRTFECLRPEVANLLEFRRLAAVYYHSPSPIRSDLPRAAPGRRAPVGTQSRRDPGGSITFPGAGGAPFDLHRRPAGPECADGG